MTYRLCTIHTPHVQHPTGRWTLRWICTKGFELALPLKFNVKDEMNSYSVRHCYSATLSTSSRPNGLAMLRPILALKPSKFFRDNFTLCHQRCPGPASQIDLTRSSCIWVPHSGALSGFSFALLICLSN